MGVIIAYLVYKLDERLEYLFKTDRYAIIEITETRTMIPAEIRYFLSNLGVKYF